MVGTLATPISPLASSTSATSVNVPPMSTPTRQAMSNSVPLLPGAKLKQIDGGAPTHGRPRHNSYALEGDEAVDAEKD